MKKAYSKKFQSNPNSGKYDTSRGVSVVLANALLGDPVCACSYVYMCWIQHMWKSEEKWEKMDAFIILWTYIMPWISKEPSYTCSYLGDPMSKGMFFFSESESKYIDSFSRKKNIESNQILRDFYSLFLFLVHLFFFTGYLCETGACTDGRKWNHLQGIINSLNILWFENEKKLT